MKRRDLVKKINESAAKRGLAPVYTEGGNHTKVIVGKRETTIPRHREIKETVAKNILRYLEG